MLHNERATPPSDSITGYPRILVIGRTRSTVRPPHCGVWIPDRKNIPVGKTRKIHRSKSSTLKSQKSLPKIRQVQTYAIFKRGLPLQKHTVVVQKLTHFRSVKFSKMTSLIFKKFGTEYQKNFQNFCKCINFWVANFLTTAIWQKYNW